ncbi:MAG: ATP-binding protein [Anaerolineales bacterium]
MDDKICYLYTGFLAKESDMLEKIRLWCAAPKIVEDREASRSASLLNIVLWMFISASSLYGIFAPIDPKYMIRRLLIIIPFAVMMIILKQILNLGYIRVVGVLMVTTMWTLFTIAMFFGPDYNNPAFMGYLVVIVTAGLVLNWKASIAWSIFSILTNGVILWLGNHKYFGFAQNETPPFAFWSSQTAYIIVITLLLSQAIRKIDEAFEKAQHEIRERKRVEAERENFIKELEAKNAELERFTYTISHDLKSPLITISGYLGLLEKDAKAGAVEKFNNDITRIRDATIKMQALLNDLLELSRIGRLMNPTEEVGFEELVHEALSIVDIQLQEKNIKVSIQEKLPSVLVDHIRMVEVLQNLLDNATKFMGEQTNPCIDIGYYLENDIPVFFIKDNGIGIGPEHYDRIFGLFNKLNPDSEGTGVGLALVKRIIELHDGTIWVQSKTGIGTTFYFTLPRKAI